MTISFNTRSYTSKMLMCQQVADMIVTALVTHDHDRVLRLWGTVPLELNVIVLRSMVEIMDTTGIIFTSTGYEYC